MYIERTLSLENRCLNQTWSLQIWFLGLGKFIFGAIDQSSILSLQFDFRLMITDVPNTLISFKIRNYLLKQPSTIFTHGSTSLYISIKTYLCILIILAIAIDQIIPHDSPTILNLGLTSNLGCSRSLLLQFNRQNRCIFLLFACIMNLALIFMVTLSNRYACKVHVFVRKEVGNFNYFDGLLCCCCELFL